MRPADTKHPPPPHILTECAGADGSGVASAPESTAIFSLYLLSTNHDLHFCVPNASNTTPWRVLVEAAGLGGGIIGSDCYKPVLISEQWIDYMIDFKTNLEPIKTIEIKWSI